MQLVVTCDGLVGAPYRIKSYRKSCSWLCANLETLFNIPTVCVTVIVSFVDPSPIENTVGL